MRKAKNSKYLSGWQTLLAVSLTATLTTVGCTTDRNVGDGNPVVTPGVRTAPTAGPTSGSETAPAAPPMYSSYTGALPAVTARVTQRSAAEAAAMMADQLPATRVLGPASPGAPGMQGYYSTEQVTGQFINPALITNPQVTVNSSISSAPTPAITDGAGGGGAIVGAVTADGAIVDAATIGTGGLTLGGNVNAAPVISTNTTALPLNVATSRALSPTASSVMTPPASISSSSTLTTVTNARTAGVATTIGAGAVTNATPLATTTARSLSPTASSVLTPLAGISTATGSSIVVGASNARATGVRTTTARAARASSATVARPVVSSKSSVRLVTGANGQTVITNTRSQQ